jgi:hypothetical protein
MCCLKRPFDDQSHPRIHLESEAVLALLGAPEGKVEFLRGAALDLENDQNPLVQRAARVRQWLEALPSLSAAEDALANRVKDLITLGLKNLMRCIWPALNSLAPMRSAPATTGSWRPPDATRPH